MTMRKCDGSEDLADPPCWICPWCLAVKDTKLRPSSRRFCLACEQALGIDYIAFDFVAPNADDDTFTPQQTVCDCLLGMFFDLHLEFFDLHLSSLISFRVLLFDDFRAYWRDTEFVHHLMITQAPNNLKESQLILYHRGLEVRRRSAA